MDTADRTRPALDGAAANASAGAGGIEDVYEVTPLQQAMLERCGPGSEPDLHLSQLTFAVDGELDVDTMVEAWQQTVAAHPSLRSSYHWAGPQRPLQVVRRTCVVPVHHHDWSGSDPTEQRARFRRLVAGDRQVGFLSLAEAPLLRLHLVRLARDQHRCIWTHHMLALDAWSQMVVMNEVLARYRHLAFGEPAPPASTGYRDHIAWLQRQDLDAAQAFWSTALGRDTGSGRVVTLQPAPWPGRAGPVAVQDGQLPAEVAAGLRSAAARHRVTFGTVLVAAWSLVLQRYGGGPVVTFGCTSSGRPAELPGINRTVGSFATNLPVTVEVPVDGDVGDWLRDVQRRASAVRRFEYSPLTRIAAWAGRAGPEPLYDSLLVLNNFPSEVTLGAVEQQLRIRLLEAFEKTGEPLMVKVYTGAGVRLVVHRDRMDPVAVAAILADFQAALAGLADATRVTEAVAAVGPLPNRNRPPAAPPVPAAPPESRPGAGRLAPLSGHTRPACTLVCVPPGGGRAAAYQPLAAAIGPGLTVLAAVLPGHEPAAEPELRPLREVAAAVVGRVRAEVEGPVAVYGHGAGAALAVEVTRLLEQAGCPVAKLFLAAAWPAYDPRSVERTLLRCVADADADADTDTDTDADADADTDPAPAPLALRHDLQQGLQYFGEQWPRRRPAAALRTPITVIVATGDVETGDSDTERHEPGDQAWQRFSREVELAEVPGGGRRLLRENPGPLAAVVRRDLRLGPRR